MAALQFGVLKTGDDVALTVADRNAVDEMKFDEEVVSRVSALIWDTVVEDWADDLVSFSTHAARQNVNLDDLALMTRRNPDLFKMACEMANVKTKLGESDTSSLKTTKGKKRKAANINQPGPSNPIKLSPLQSREPSIIGSRSCSPVLVTRTPSNKIGSPSSKQAKLETVEPEKGERIHSFLKTPAVKQMTSTPKVTTTMSGRQLFEKDLTPIRPSTSKEAKLIGNMTNIEEENEVLIEPDSFDQIFGDPQPSTSTSTKPDISSLIRRAEEDPAPTESTVMRRMEYERLNAMVPNEQEYDSFDDDIIVESVIPLKKSVPPPTTTTVESAKRVTFSMSADLREQEKETTRDRSAENSKSPDLFAGETSSSTLSAGSVSNHQNQPPVTPVSRGPKPIFSNKLSAFKFDDEDSLDAPLKGSIPLPSKATSFSSIGSVETKTKALIVTETLSDDSFDEAPGGAVQTSKKITKEPEVIDLEADSFDIPIPSSSKNQKKQSDSQSSSQSIPKWKATADKWKKAAPAKSTPKRVVKTPGSGSESTKNKKKVLDYDSFDEFDFDV